MLCPVHKQSTKLALLNDRGTGTLCWTCEANRVNESLTRQLAKAKFDLGEAISTCHDRDMQIISLTCQLVVAKKTLERITELCNQYKILEINRYEKLGIIATEGLKEMEEVK